MGLVKISELTAATPLTGTEVYPLVQSGNTRKGPGGSGSNAPINIKSAPYNAVGDGTTDDTAAIQAAINACIGAGDPTTTGRVAIHSLFIPIGIYKVTAPLVVRGVRGFNMVGESPFASIIAHAGTFAQVLHLDGIAYSTFRNFRIGGISGSVTNAINLEKGTGTALGVTRNHFENIHILADVTCVNLLALGTAATLAVDENMFVSCVFAGNSISDPTYWQYGVLQGSGGAGNVLGNVFLKCNFNNLLNGIRFSGTSGAVISCGFQNNHTDINNSLINRNLMISNCRSEGALRFYLLGSGSGSGGCMDVVIDNCEINGANYVVGTSDNWIDHRSAGHLNIRNTTLIGVPVGVTPKIFTSTQSSSRLTVIIDGLAAKGASTAAVTTGVATPDIVNVVIHSYIEIDQATGAAISSYVGPHIIQSAGNFSGALGLASPAIYSPTINDYIVMGNPGNSNRIVAPTNDGIKFEVSGANIMHIRQTGNIDIGDTRNITLNTSTGTKIGTGTTQKLGFWNATPVSQPAANPDTSGAALGDLETEVNQLKALLRSVGLMAP